MRTRWWRALSVFGALAMLLAAGPAQGAPRPVEVTTDATYFNNAATPGADPFVLYDKGSGYYYAYSTDGADPGYHFAIYRSADIATWEQVPGGALKAEGQWGHDWFWAPEVYHNPATGRYFLFYAARMNENVADHFGFADFEEPCKIGVAVSSSPAGPFTNIAAAPIDYYPYDPEYYDVNRIMDSTQRKPPATLEEGRTAPRGTYLPYIDPNVYFDDNGRIYLYFSRNAYRNWVWDPELGKYIEESNIYAVELTADWWHDPAGATMPAVQPRYVNANQGSTGPARKDGYQTILNYGSDRQAWENAHVNDYDTTQGAKKDRRWAEGSTTVKTYVDGRPVYYLTYSANNYENQFYGVGYAVADSPLGPWRKSRHNPVLAQDPGRGMFSTGHGSMITSPDGSRSYYVHHGRPSTVAGRSLYTERLRLDRKDPDSQGNPRLLIDQSTADEPVPPGIAPYALTTNSALVQLAGPGSTAGLGWKVTSSAGAALPLANPLNRVRAALDPPGVASLRQDSDGVTLTAREGGVAALTVSYQRAKAAGGYVDVHNLTRTGVWQSRDPVSATVPVASCTRTITGRHQGKLDVTAGVVCLRGAAVSGPVRVTNGASLVAVDSVLSGPVTAMGPGAVWISGGRVSGPLAIRAATGLVRLDGATVFGPVSIRDSAAGATLDRATVHGGVSVSGNHGPLIIAATTVRGALTCTGNDPAPTDGGQPNQVRGPATGQCRGW